MKKTIAGILAALLLMTTLVGCGGGTKEVTWEDYQQWLISILPDICPVPDAVGQEVMAAKNWDEIDTSSGPWVKIFGEEYYNASTWDEFVAAGGVGTYNAEYEDMADPDAPSGDGPAASGEPSGEPTGEMAGETAD